ncbi:MAG: outer membrane beta-barrel protein [Bacteroidales bacterium]|nr:outer membrane beta-barrel protein [Bacteroidales bacterium]
MKKTIRFAMLAVLLAMAGSLSAQTMINGGFKITVLQTDNQDSKAYGGFYAGATQNVVLSRHVGVAPGIYFSRFTGDNESTVAGITTHNKLTESEIAVPVPINVMMHITDVSMFYIYVGPEFNIGLSSKGESWLGDNETHTTYDLYEEGVPGELGRYNISWIGGIGAKFDFLNVNLGLSGNIFNRLYDSDINQKAINVLLGIGLAF